MDATVCDKQESDLPFSVWSMLLAEADQSLVAAYRRYELQWTMDF